MINAQQKAILKEILGNNYVSKIQDKLAEKKIVKNTGEPYSVSSIRATLNDGYENIDIEKCIYEVATEIKKEKDAIAEMRDKLLKGKPHSKPKITE